VLIDGIKNESMAEIVVRISKEEKQKVLWDDIDFDEEEI
jgi:hypothetical protein